MSTVPPLGIGIVGCGNIAGPYAKCISAYPDELKIVGACDLMPERAQELADEYGCRAFPDLEALLACDEIEAAINLTIHTAHSEVTRQILEGGKHVHSEKPLAIDRAAGKAVVELAKDRGLLLGCSPFVVLGEAQQTLWKVVRDDMVGDVLEVIAEMMHGRIESWHPSPAPFYGLGAGPMLDVGCYPLNVLTSIFGPVRSVRGAAQIRIPERTIASGPKAGETFEVTTPDHVTGLLDFASGVGGRLSASFVVCQTSHAGIEVHGTKGSLHLSSPVGFNSTLKFAAVGEKDWTPVPPIAEPFAGVDWARGMLDMADAIRNDRPLRCTGEQANHILDVCLSVLDAAESGETQTLDTTFERPEPVCA